MQFEVFPTVSSIAHKNVLIASPDISVREATRLIYEHGVSSILIEQEQRRFIVSVETLLDYVRKTNHTDHPLSKLPLHEVVCIRQDEHVLAAMESLEQSQDRYLAVVDEANQVVGIVTYTDILSALDPAVLVEKRTIGELLKRDVPVTFTPDWILEDVLFHLSKLEDSIIVVEDNTPVGIVTTKDVFGLLSSGRPTTEPLSAYMSSPVITTPTTASIHDTLLLMKNRNIKRAVVTDDHQKLLGVVTQSELVGYAYGTWINLIKHHATELRELVAILEMKARSYEKESMTDPLTELGNRRYFQKRMDEETERANRYHEAAFSALLFDIDFFKKINDTHGHLVGDEILKSIGRELSASVRKSDEVCRWGGEEFVILLPHTDLHAASELASRIRERVERHLFAKELKVTISGGGGEYQRGEQVDHFMDRIDKALYQAKLDGRNRVVLDRWQGDDQEAQ